MASTRGRRVEVPLTNKSGGAVAAGDVVILDSANDDAFTTTTTGQYTGTVGIAQETIANNATGRVLLQGEAALVNVPASVTRGHYLETHTVAKQGTGNSTRRSGSFGQFKTGGTTPKAVIWASTTISASGNVASDTIWDAAGDLAVGSGADTAAKLSIGASGKVPASNGTTLAYIYPPGYEFDYVEITAPVSVTQTTEGAADTIVTANSVSMDGSTVIYVEFYSPSVTPASDAASRNLNLYLYDNAGGAGAASIGRVNASTTPAAAASNRSVMIRRRLTPSNATHVYSIRGAVSGGTGTVSAGAGGSGNLMPAYIRVVKA